MMNAKKFFKFIFFVFCFLTVESAHASIQKKTSFAVSCQEHSSPFHLLPLSFLEFSNEKISTLPTDNLEKLKKISPTLSLKLSKETSKTTANLEVLTLPTYEEHAAIVAIPKNCKVIKIIQEDLHNPNVMVLNSEAWNMLSVPLQKYFQFEYLLQASLKKGLEGPDYRRFSYEFATGMAYNYTDREMISFLQTYGVSDYVIAGIPVNLNSEIIFYPNTDLVQDAFPAAGATFEKARINQKRFITFTKDKKVKALSTSTPFVRNIHGQDFHFFIPEKLNLTGPEIDPRYHPRIEFHEDGGVASAAIKPVTHFLDIVTTIKSKSEFFAVAFLPGYQPLSFIIGECSIFSEGCAGYGTFFFNNQKLKISKVTWYENKNIHSMTFAKTEIVDVPGQGRINLHDLIFNEDGTPLSGWPAPAKPMFP